MPCVLLPGGYGQHHPDGVAGNGHRFGLIKSSLITLGTQANEDALQSAFDGIIQHPHIQGQSTANGDALSRCGPVWLVGERVIDAGLACSFVNAQGIVLYQRGACVYQ